MFFRSKITYLFLMVIFLSPSVNANDIDVRNNSLHVIGSMAIGSAVQAYSDNTIISFGSCMGVGIVKEALDYYSNNPERVADMNDIYWNLLGCSLGVLGVKGIQTYVNKDRLMIGYTFNY